MKREIADLSLDLSFFGPISDKSLWDGQCVLFAKFQKFHRASQSSHAVQCVTLS